MKPGYTVLYSSNGDESDEVDLKTKKTFVLISDDYNFTLHPDVRAGGTYKFIGANANDVDLSLEDYSNQSRWVLGKATENQFGVGGTFYKYLGADADDLDLSLQDYTDTTKWQQIKRNLATEDYSNETYWARTASITAVSVAASLGIGIAGAVGIAVSGAGAESTNAILTKVNAYITDSNVTAAGKVDLDAANTASIDAVVVGVSAALGIGGKVGLAIPSAWPWRATMSAGTPLPRPCRHPTSPRAIPPRTSSPRPTRSRRATWCASTWALAPATFTSTSAARSSLITRLTTP